MASKTLLLVSRPVALSTPHAWAPCDLGFPLPLGVLLITSVFSRTHLSWSNSAVWITDVRCHNGLTLLPRTRQYILVTDIRPLIGTLARVACGTLAHVACGTQLTWPTITSSQRCPRTGRYSYALWFSVYIHFIHNIYLHQNTYKIFYFILFILIFLHKFLYF